MKESYRVVKLLQNRAYPTYQLYAQMANKKTKPEDGLRFAALTTLQWVKRRLGEHMPPEWEDIPEPAQYLTAGNDCLVSQHINKGYVIDIVSLPEHGVWSLQISEPDLGSDPGRLDQKRLPVAGRVIETNVAFRIADSILHCGFKTVVSDPEGVEEQAEVYRLAIVRQLADAPMFGLKQITPLTEELIRINKVGQVKGVIEVWHSAENQLPCVLFSQVVEQPKEMIPPQFPITSSIQTSMPLRTIPPYFSISTAKLADSKLPLIIEKADRSKREKKPALQKPPESSPTINDPPYDMKRFAKYGVTFCRTYLLEEPMRERFERLSGLKVQPGDIIVLEPDAFGGKTTAYPLKPSSKAQKELVEQLRSELYTYPRGKEVTFGRIAFLTAAHERLLRHTDDLDQQSKDLDSGWQQRVTMLREEWEAELAEKDAAYEALSRQLERQRDYQARLEAEKMTLREQHVKEIEALQRQLADRDEDIRYLRRKLSQPSDHGEIAAWVREQFGSRLVLHQKAVNLLADRSAKTVDVELICDALDFLATDYWEHRYQQISEQEMLTRCSTKYGRPFDIAPTGSMSIEMMPGEYKIKYFRSGKDKPKESALDYHLRVGNDAENLLRIYFLHDDEKRLIVIGSLPRHLKTARIQ